jgi:hypothetical protein
MREITIEINHSVNATDQDIFKISLEFQENGHRYSGEYRITQEVITAEEAMVITEIPGGALIPLEAPVEKNYSLPVSIMTPAVCSVTPYQGVLHINNIPLLNAHYTIKTNYPIVLSQEPLTASDAASVAAQFRDKKIPSCTIVATKPSASVVIANIVFFDILKLSCLESQVNIQGNVTVNRLLGLVHTLLNPEKSQVKIQETMNLESHQGGVTNHGVWDALNAYCNIGMKYFHNQPTGQMFFGTLECDPSFAGRPIVTNEGYCRGGRLEGYLSRLVCTKGSQTVFKSAGAHIMHDLKVAGLFIHEDSAKYTVDEAIEIQTGGRFFAKRCLEIVRARYVTVQKDAFLGAKFSFQCPVQNLVTEEGSYYGCPGYTTLEISNGLVLKGETVPGYSLVVEAQTLFANINSQQKYSNITISEEYRNAGMMSATHNTATVGSFINMPGASVVGDFLSIQAQYIENQGIRGSLGYELLEGLRAYSLDESLQKFAGLGLMLYSNIQQCSETSMEAFAITQFEAILAPYRDELQEQPFLLHPRFETEILPKIRLLSTDKRIEALQAELPNTQTVAKSHVSSEMAFSRAYNTAGLRQEVGFIGATTSLLLGAQQTINKGIIVSKFNLTVQSVFEITNLMGAYILAYGTLSLKSQAVLLNIGNIIAKCTVDCTATDWFKQLGGGRLSAEAVNLFSKRIEHSGITEGERLHLHATNTLEQFINGKISATQAITLLAGEVVNQGVIECCGNIFLVVQHLIQNQAQGKISAVECLLILCGSVVRDAGRLEAGENFIAVAKTLFDNIVSGNPIDTTAVDVLTNVAIENAGLLSGQNVSIMSASRAWVRNLKEGLIQGETIAMGGDKLQNAGTIQSKKTAILRYRTLIEILDTGLIDVKDLIELTANRVANHGTIRALKDICINARLLFKNTGTVLSIDNLGVLCATLIAVIEETDSPTLAVVKKEAQEILGQVQRGTEPSPARVEQLIQFVLNNTVILAGHYPKLLPRPNVDFAQPLSLETEVLLAHLKTGVLSPKSLIQIKAGLIENTGTLASLGQISLVADEVLSNIENGLISGQAGLALMCGTLLENTGRISAYHNIRVTAQQLLQSMQSGKILSQEDVHLILETSLVNAGVISGKKVNVMRKAMATFLETQPLEAEPQTLREHLIVQNLNSGLIKATDALTILAESAENAGHLEADSARLHFEKHFTQSGTLTTENKLSLEAGNIITLLQSSKITAKGAMSLLAKQRVFTQGDILAYQSLSIVVDTLEHAGGKINGHDNILISVSDWILKGNIEAQKHLIAKIKNTWDWQAEGRFSAAKDGMVSLQLDRGYTFTRPIALATTLNLACDSTATLQNLTDMMVDSFGVYGGTFLNGSGSVFSKITASAGKYTFEGVYHDNVQGGLYSEAGFNITASQGIVNGRVQGSYMITPGQSTFKTPTLTNNYGQLRVGSNSAFLGQAGQDVLVNLSGDVDIAGNATIQGNVKNTMLYQVTSSNGVTRGRALSKCPLFTVQGNLNQQGLFENVGGSVLICGETHVSQGGFIGRALEEYDAWTTIAQIQGKRKGWFRGHHYHTEITNHRKTHAMHLGNFTYRGTVYSHDASYFNFSSAHMENGMEGQYRYFGVHQPHDTITLSEYARAHMGLFAKSLHLEGVPGSEMVFNSQQHIAEDFVLNAPEGSFTQNEQTRDSYELARLDKKAFGLQSVKKSNSGTGHTTVGGTMQILVKDFHRIGGDLSYGKDSTIMASLMETVPLRTTRIEDGGRGHAIVPHFAPVTTRGQGNLHVIADTIVGNAHYIIKGQAKFEYTHAMLLQLVCEYYQLPQEKQKELFKNVYSGGLAPVIVQNVIDASLGVVFISTNGQTVLQNTIFPNGQPIFKVPQARLQRTFQYPQPNLYCYSQLNIVAQLGTVAVAAAAAYFTGGLLTNALLPAVGSTLALTASQAVFVGAVQGIVGGGVQASLTKGNIAKSMLQGAILGGLGGGLSSKLEAMETFKEISFINPEALRRAAVSVPVAMAATGMNHGNLLKDSLLALGGSFVRSALPSEKLSDLSAFEAIQQEATNACIAGITMAVVTGANSQQAVSIGLQSAGYAIANLAGESLGTALAKSHLEHKQAKAQQFMVAQRPVESEEAQRPEAGNINRTDHSVYSQSEILEIATKEASRLLEKEGIHVSDAEIKSTFKAHPALQGSPQEVESRLIKLGRAGNGSKNTRTAFVAGLEKVFAATVNCLMGLVGIGEAHAANQDLMSERELQRYNPELERKIFLSRGLTEELWGSGGGRMTSDSQSNASGKALLFLAPSKRVVARSGKLLPKQPTTQSERVSGTRYEIIIKISTDSPSGHVYMYAPIADKTGKLTPENIGFYPAKKGFDIKAGISKVPAKIVIEDNDTNKNAKQLVTVTLRLTPAQYGQLAKNLARAIDNPGFYNFFGLGAPNCLTFIDQQLKAIGIVDGLSNKFDISQYEKTRFAPIKMQANWQFDLFKEQMMLVACGSEDTAAYDQYKDQLAKQRVAAQYFVDVRPAQQNNMSTTKPKF